MSLEAAGGLSGRTRAITRRAPRFLVCPPVSGDLFHFGRLPTWPPTPLRTTFAALTLSGPVRDGRTKLRWTLHPCRCHRLMLPDVAHGEDPRTWGFEQIRRALEWPFRSGEILRRQVRPGLEEAFRVERDLTIPPARMRLRSVIRKTCLISRLDTAPLPFRQRHTFQPPISLESHDLRSRSDLDRRGLFELVRSASNTPELQVPPVASPRNHRHPNHEVAGFRRPRCIFRLR